MSACIQQQTVISTAQIQQLDQRGQQFFREELDEEPYIQNFQEITQCRFIERYHTQYQNQQQDISILCQHDQEYFFENFVFSMNQDLRIFIIEGFSGLGKSKLLKQIENYCWKTLELSKTRIYPININTFKLVQYSTINLFSILRDNQLDFNEDEVNKLEADIDEGKIALAVLIDNCEQLGEDINFGKLLEFFEMKKSRIFLTLNSACSLIPFYDFLLKTKISFFKIALRLFEQNEIIKYIQQSHIKQIKNVVYQQFNQKQLNDNFKDFWQKLFLELKTIKEVNDYTTIQQIINKFKDQNNKQFISQEGIKLYYQILRIYQKINSQTFINFLKDNQLEGYAQYPLFLNLISIVLVNFITRKFDKDSTINYLGLLILLINQGEKTGHISDVYDKNFQKKIKNIRIQCDQILNLLYNQSNQQYIINSRGQTECSQSQQLKINIKNKLINFFLAFQFNYQLDQLGCDCTQIEEEEIQLLKNIKNNTIIGSINLLLEEFKFTLELLKHIYRNNQSAKLKLIKLVKASAIINDFNQIAGNAFTILNGIQPIIRNEDFCKIQIVNSSIDQIHFQKCNFQSSIMDNIDISQANFIECNIQKSSWRKITINYQCQAVYQIDSQRYHKVNQNYYVSPFYFFPDGKHIIVQNMQFACFLRISTGKQLFKHKTPLDFAISADCKLLALYDSMLPFIQILQFKTGKLIRKLKFKEEIFQSIIVQLKFSQNGEYLATFDGKEDFYCWSLRDGKKMQIEINAYCIYFLAFQPNQPRLAYSSRDGAVIVKDIILGNEVKQLQTTNQPCINIFFSSDGQNFARSSSKELYVWDVNAWELRKIIEFGQEKFYYVSMSNDWKTLAVGQDRIIKLFNFDGMQKISQLKGHTESVKAMEFSPNSKILASRDTQDIRLWSTKKLDEKVNQGHSLLITQVDLSLNGQFMASSSHDGSVRIWNRKDGSLYLSHSQLNSFSIECVKFSPNGKSLVFGNNKGNIYFWDLLTNLTKQFDGHRNSVTNLLFSCDGQMVISSGVDNVVHILEIRNGKLIESFDSVLNSCFAISEDFKLFASVQNFQTIQLWSVLNIQRVEKIAEIKGQFKEQFKGISIIAFSLDAQILFSGGKDFQLWNVQTQRKIQDLNVHKVVALAFSRDGQIFATGSKDYTIKLWSLKNLQAIQTILNYSGGPNSIQFSIDGYFLILAASDKTIRMWSALKGYQIEEFNQTNHFNNLQKQFYKNITLNEGNLTQSDKNYQNFIQIVYSKKSNIVASLQYDDFVQIWNLKQRTSISTLKHFPGKINFTIIAISKSGLLLASAGIDNTIIMWNLEDFQVKLILKGHSSSIKSMSFSPNDQILASSSEYMDINIWNVQSGQLIKRLNEHAGIVNVVTFSENGEYLASCCKEDKTIRLWKIDCDFTSSQILQFEDNDITAIAFSPNTKFIAIGCKSAKLQILDILSQLIIHQLKGHTGQIISVDFSFDGNLLVSGSNDTTIRLWEISDGSLIRCIYSQEELTSSAFFIQDKLEIIYGTKDGNIKKEKVYPDYSIPFELYQVIGERKFYNFDCLISNSIIQSTDGIGMETIFK